MLEILKEKNPEIKVYSCFDEEFKSYGRVIKSLNTKEIVEVGTNVQMPENAVKYVPTLEEFEGLDIAEEIRKEFFGTLPTQIGFCWGYNSFLNATEWHTASEINIAITDVVLILAHLWEIEDNKIDSSLFRAFYIPKGTAIECYATSLHYCPCQASDDGFRCVVALPAGTNTSLEEKVENKIMVAKNKWLICHNDNEDAIANGDTPDISGINHKIKY